MPVVARIAGPGVGKEGTVLYYVDLYLGLASGQNMGMAYDVCLNLSRKNASTSFKGNGSVK